MVTRHVWSALIAVPILELIRQGVLTIPAVTQGFFCEDPEIRYPHSPETITSDTMHAIFFLLAALLVVGVECTLIRHLTRGQRRRLMKDNQRIHPGILNIIYFLIALGCSILTVSVIVILGKRTVSRLRPNFLAVCQPNLTALCPPNTFRYVDDYVCYGDTRTDEYLSFPSGHAAESTAFAVYTIFYLQKRCKMQEPIRPFLQLLIFLLAFFISLTRVRDNMHRLVDVAAGAFIGFFVGAFFVTYVLRRFRSSRYAVEEMEELPCQAEVVKSVPIMPTVIVHERPATTYHQPQSCYGTMNSSGANSSSAENLSDDASLVVQTNGTQHV